jgi:hypothetical protein
MVLIEMIWIVRINDFENILLCLVLVLFWKWKLVTCFWSKQVSMESVVFLFWKECFGALCGKKRFAKFWRKMTFLDSKWFGVSVWSIWEIRNGLGVLHYVWFRKTMVLE